MFTGLVEETAKVLETSSNKLRVKSSLEVKIGDSVSVNGACLTVVSLGSGAIEFDVSEETLRRTNIKFLKRGDFVNLERALKLGERLGGHIVQGHVDTTFKISAKIKKGSFWRFGFTVNRAYKKYIFEKASIAIDGISLTISQVAGNTIFTDVIPHTYASTNLKFRKVGELVNVEFDVLSKIVEALIRDSRIVR